MRVIDADTLIEEILMEIPDAVTYLMNKGIRCFVCGEPLWGTLRAAALEKGFSETDIQQFVAELQALAVARAHSAHQE